ncbi:MAG: SDR family oxidoreductase [Desulfuromonadales bacterium]|nr:SDR family oxidoreductase [Desulfuromonadales bacterium]
MKILILGGDGMLGHQLLTSLLPRHEVRVTLRQDLEAYREHGLFTPANAYAGVDVRSLERLTEVVADFQPAAVINAVGIVKQRPTARESIPSLEINALLPHRLAVLCRAAGARLVHLSTDCVFSGKTGHYRDDDPSDAEDLYGKSKFLGEVHDNRCLTLRTSIIGRELARKKSLLEWFLAQSGPVKGFTNAIYSGFTTPEMSRIIEMLLVKHPDAHGVYQVSSEPINKYELLLLFRDKFGKEIDIVPDAEFKCDRSLDSRRFRQVFDYAPPSWEAMIEELAGERQP